MASLNNVPQGKLIEKTAEKLKQIKDMEPPEWVNFARTGVHKQRPPQQKDWWYMRCAAILRTLATRGPIGVSKLRTKYGGKQRRGHKPAKFAKGSGSVIRHALQHLVKAGLAETKEKEQRKGRIISKQGIKVLNDSAKDLFKEFPKKVAKEQPKAKEEETKAKVKEEKPEAKEQPAKEEKPEAKEQAAKEEKVQDKKES